MSYIMYVKPTPLSIIYYVYIIHNTPLHVNATLEGRHFFFLQISRQSRTRQTDDVNILSYLIQRHVIL